MSEQLYLTDNIRLVVEPTASDWLVVTFAHMDFEKGDGCFWGQEPLRKLGYSLIGIVGRGNNWFPQNDMFVISNEIRKVARTHQKTILYGFSMGGYAAIKYGQLLGADISIALSPQYSIDPKDVFPHDDRLTKNFNSDLNKDMAITKSDLSGTIYLFYDPFVTEDRWNYDQIVRQDPAGIHINALPTPRIGHETIDLFSSTERLAELIQHCTEADIAALRTVTAKSRRAAPRRAYNTLSKLYESHPTCAARLLTSRSAQLPDYWRNQWEKLLSCDSQI